MSATYIFRSIDSNMWITAERNFDLFRPLAAVLATSVKDYEIVFDFIDNVGAGNIVVGGARSLDHKFITVDFVTKTVTLVDQYTHDPIFTTTFKEFAEKYS